MRKQSSVGRCIVVTARAARSMAQAASLRERASRSISGRYSTRETRGVTGAGRASASLRSYLNGDKMKQAYRAYDSGARRLLAVQRTMCMRWRHKRIPRLLFAAAGTFNKTELA